MKPRSKTWRRVDRALTFVFCMAVGALIAGALGLVLNSLIDLNAWVMTAALITGAAVGAVAAHRHLKALFGDYLEDLR